jgi:hypothetical protein
MKPGIRFIREWADEDMVELRTEISDGRSLFVNRIYVGHQQLREAVAGLDAFKTHIYGGIFNLRFGEFGSEYASGAVDARLQFRKQGKILLRVSAQSGFDRFEEKELASEATLHLVSEPALLDEFIRALRALSKANSEQAELEAISWN